jgi:hypothetical protein
MANLSHESRQDERTQPGSAALLVIMELEGELDGAGAADLVEGVEPTFAPPEPRLLARVWVEWPRRGPGG